MEQQTKSSPSESKMATASKASVIKESKEAPKFKYQENEKVLCYHGPLLYEAKCIKSQVKDKQIKYFIHYSGWNKNWDEWVPESRVLKYNEANLQKQRDLENAHLKTKKVKLTQKKKETTQIQEKPKRTLSKSNDDNVKKKKTKVEPHVESEESYLSKAEIKVRIPDELKSWLVDDWDMITHQKKLFILPAKITVDQILQDFYNVRLSGKGSASKQSILQEVTNGIRDYFNIMLGNQLLYKFERPQYSSIMAKYTDSQPSQIYGGIHLLRLFAKLGSMLAYTALDEKSVQMLLTHVHDFLKYLAHTTTIFSLNDYEVASPEYHRQTM